MSQRVGTVKALRLPRHANSDRVGRRAAASLGVWATPDTSAPKPSQRQAKTSCFEAGLGCSGRRASACGSALSSGAEGSGGFRPFDGGTLEWTGVFDGYARFASWKECVTLVDSNRSHQTSA